MQLRSQIKKILSIHSALFFLVLTLLSFALTALSPTVLAQTPSPSRASVVRGTNGSMAPQGAADPHLRLSPERPQTSADVAAANQLAQQLRAAIAQYANVSDARKAGYIKFPPDDENFRIVHYVNPWLSFLETWRIDPQKPGSLLYERDSDGSLHLLGAMFTAPAEAKLADINQRIPLSVTHWHQHTNICVPKPIWDEQQWARQSNGRPLFGPDSFIATRRDCEAVNGEFHPTILGWMVHANVFAAEPADVWNPMYGYEES